MDLTEKQIDVIADALEKRVADLNRNKAEAEKLLATYEEDSNNAKMAKFIITNINEQIHEIDEILDLSLSNFERVI